MDAPQLPAPAVAEEQDVIEHDEWRSLFTSKNNPETDSAKSSDHEHRPFALAEFEAEASEAAAMRTVSMELGRARVSISELNAKQIVTLDRREQDRVDLWCGERLLARGEMIVLRGKLCLRITEIVEA